MKIVHLITGLEGGGTETMLCRLLSRMDRSRFENAVVSMTGEGRMGARIAAMGIPVRTLRMQPGRLSFSGALRLITFLRRFKPNVLQTWLYHADLLGLLAGKLGGVPSVAWNIRCADLSREDHPGHLWWTIKILAKLSRFPDVVVVNSGAGRAANERLGYRPRRWEQIPNGFDLNMFHPSDDARRRIRRELGLPFETALVGMVARFDPMKDHSMFLRAARQLQESRSDVHFVLVGNGVDRANPVLSEQVSRLALRERVHLLGERSDGPDIFAALDVACCASYSEGFPNVVGEAMACGVPCVVTDVGDCREIVGDTGIVVPAKNPEAMADGLARMLNLSADDRGSLGVKARARIAAFFDIDAVVRRYEALYEELSRASA